MDHRTRICSWIILIGLGNFLAYSIVYWLIGGEAFNGHTAKDFAGLHYYLQTGKEVGPWVFLYSGIHSISIWPTVAAIMLSMLTLAKDRIVFSANTKAARSRLMVTLLAVLIGLATAMMTVIFVHQFSGRLANPLPPGTQQVQVQAAATSFQTLEQPAQAAQPVP